MKEVYVLLTRSQTLLSRAIRRATGDRFTHASIAFDQNLRTLCSFARRQPALPLPAGLVLEPLDDGYFERHRYIPCALLAVPLGEEACARLRRRIQAMFDCRGQYRYSVRGLLMCRMGIPERRPGRYFCSQFVGELLEDGGARLFKPASLMRPQDFLSLPGARCLYAGRLSGLMHDPARLLNRGMGNVDFQ